MYSEADLESAIASGALTAEAAEALRAHVAGLRSAPAVDEEHFRLITGFNDIFVSIAGILVMVGLGWSGGSASPFVGAALVAAAAWGMAEYFTRQRRMALPSILFLLAFVGSSFALFMTGVGEAAMSNAADSTKALIFAGGAAFAGAAALLHWRRFKVPVTVAAGAGALVGMAFSLVLAAVPALEDHLNPLIFVAGLGVFVLAMRWDMSDRDRKTRRSDVAFWLHLLAAPLIVHPAFMLLGDATGDDAVGKGLLVLAIYVVLAAVALLVDRRAIMVSSLAYVLAAIGGLFKELGAISLNVAITALIIGGSLLLLSVFWHSIRARIVALAPDGIVGMVPPVNRIATA
jgi:hypothetical protein